MHLQPTILVLLLLFYEYYVFHNILTYSLQPTHFIAYVVGARCAHVVEAAAEIILNITVAVCVCV